MSIETCEELETLSADNAIADAEDEYAADGQLHNARDVLSSLRRKHLITRRKN